MSHPYSTLPPERFWSRGVSQGRFDAVRMLNPHRPLLEAGQKAASAGSCFAVNVVPHLEKAGFGYVRTEAPHPRFAGLPDTQYGYASFSAAYGHIYTSRQMLQLLLRALGKFTPVEDRWLQDGAVIDAFRPGLRWPAWSDREFDLLTRQHLDRTLDALRLADVFIFTLGLTECWASAKDGAVYPACPGTIAGAFDPAAHTFVNLGVADVKADLAEIFRTLAAINPRLRIILTVSPVPLVATATPGHVVAATLYSKSALVAAAVEAAQEHSHVNYFPSYEIITGPQAPEGFFEADRRNVSTQGIDAVMGVLLAHCAGGAGPSAAPPRPADLEALSQAIATAECEEMAVERP